MHIALVTAGGAGMYCGSCMHDNTWAKALLDAGAKVTLVPTYTPIRLDEKDQSGRQVYFGGLSVYLNYRFGVWRRLPRAITQWVDTPWVIRMATSFGVSNDAQELGALTLAMLQGDQGPQKQELSELVDYLADELKPDVILFSNALLAGAIPPLKKKFAGPVLSILQGDDIFLEGLIEPFKAQVLARMRMLVREFDGFLVHSDYYRDFMGRYLEIPREKFRRVPLGIDLNGHDGVPRIDPQRPFTVGYFARICPEKGLHQLLAAFRLLHQKHPQARLRAGGYLGPRDQKYFDDLQQSAQDLGDAFKYIGSPNRAEKVAFLKSLDVLSVPTEYHEPKGLYVLEALANGVPVVQPRHGSFPEILAATQGGLLVEPQNPQALAAALEELLLDPPRRLELGRIGQENVRRLYGPQPMAAVTLETLRPFIQRTPGEHGIPRPAGVH